MTAFQPQAGSAVQPVEIVGDTGHDELFQKALTEVTERTLNFAFAFSVASLTGLDLGPMPAGELQCWRMQTETAALRRTEATHPIGATHLWDTTDRVEEAGHALEGVLPIN